MTKVGVGIRAFIADRSLRLFSHMEHFHVKALIHSIIILILVLICTNIVVQPEPRPAFTQELQQLRPVILQVAHEHNVARISKMSDSDFAVVITLILYNEDLGTFEEKFKFLRAITSVRREAEIDVNEIFGLNLSIRPSNIRPSVAYEMLRHELPVPNPINTIRVPVSIYGGNLNTATLPSQPTLYKSITRELSLPDRGIEYLGANLERGMYRAQYEGVPVSFRTLMAWHIRGVVSNRDINNNRDAYNYTQRLSYLEYACELIYQNTQFSHSQICKTMV